MARIPADKTYFTFNKGLYTEASELTFPDEVSQDEENYELLVDGSRRRRKGLANEEDGGGFLVIDEVNPLTDVTATYKWTNVARDPDVVVLVVQIGQNLHFYLDSETVGNTKVNDVLNLGQYATTGDPNDVAQNPISFTQGRGLLFITGKYLSPRYVQFDVELSEFTSTEIDIQAREFEDVEDGNDLMTQPTEATITNSHKWNLTNRGWTFIGDTEADAGTDNIGTASDYRKNASAWPSRAQVPWYGFATANATNVAQNEEARQWFDLGAIDRTWSTDKMKTQIFGMATAPKGSIIIDPFNTTIGIAPNGGGTVEILDWELDPNQDPRMGGINTYPRTWRVQITLPPGHGLSVGDQVHITGNTHRMWFSGKPSGSSSGDWFESLGWTGENPRGGGGYWVPLTLKTSIAGIATGDPGYENTIWIDDPKLHYAWHFAYFFEKAWNGRMGVVNTKLENNDNGEIIDERPQAIEFFSGRVFYAGIKSRRWSDGVFFSKVTEDDRDYGTCLQAADPTHPVLNSLQPNDGGYIQIPNIGSTVALKTFKNRLLTFGNNGVFEISGSRFFAADDIQVSKLSDVEGLSQNGVISTDDAVIFTSYRGVYMITEDQYGNLVIQSLTESKVQNYWNTLEPAAMRTAKLVYDEVKRRIIILHSKVPGVPNQYDSILTLDLRLGGFYKYKFDTDIGSYILGAVPTDLSTKVDEYTKIKYFVLDEGSNLGVADFNSTTFEDWNGTERVPFLVTGYDNLGDFQRQRQAPVLHTYSKNAETGYDLNGPINDSSTFVEAHWNWTADSSTGKWSSPQQVYRKPRVYSATSATDVDPHIVVHSRSKLRGRGKALSLKFYGEEGKDSHILGWALQYQGTSEV